MSDLSKATIKNLLSSGNSIFQLSYKKGGILQTAHFVAKNLQEAIERGNKYCAQRKLKFIHVSEWLIDPDEIPDPNTLMP